MPALFILAGPAGVEKTVWMQQLAAELTRRGRRVMVVAAPPQDPPIPEGVEAWLELGAVSYSLRGREAEPPSLDEIIARQAPGVDLVLSEAHLEAKAHKLEWRPAGAAPALHEDPNLKAVVGPGPAAEGAPVYDPADVAGQAELILGLAPAAQAVTARILVDGRRLPAKDFVQDIVASTVRALVGSLKGGDKAERIEMHLY